MKLIRSNGKELEVRDVGPVIYRLLAGRVPIKLHGWMILENDEARERVRELLGAGLDHRPDSSRDSADPIYPGELDAVSGTGTETKSVTKSAKSAPLRRGNAKFTVWFL